MSADLLERLAAIDPAASMPEVSSADDERLLTRVFAWPLAADRRRPGARRRRLVIAAVATAAILLLATSVVFAARMVLHRPPTPAKDTLMSGPQVTTQYRHWTHKLELPPGVKWNKNAHPGGQSWGGNSGVMEAYDQAIGAWAKEWIAAAQAGDASGIAAADAAFVRILATLPLHTEGMTENQGGYDKSVVDQIETAITDARNGHLEGMAQFIQWADPIEYGPMPDP